MKFNSNVTGYQNEFQIAKSLNGKKIKELDPMYKGFIEDIFDKTSDEDWVGCYAVGGIEKYDIVIKIKEEKRRISIKKGVKNSMHVESVGNFIHFLIENNISRNSIIEYLKYHYADGTTNGTGLNRMGVSEYKISNQNKIDLINEEINQKCIIEKAIDRFVLKGNVSDKYIDAILFGVKDDFVWIKRDEIKEVIHSKIDEYSTAVHFGPLTIQPLDRCLNRNPKYDKKRFYIQVKWYNLSDDIIEYMNTKLSRNVAC